MAMPQHKLVSMPLNRFLARQRRMVPLAAILIAGCHPALPPPPLDAAALRQVELADFQTLGLPLALLKAPATSSGFCLDEHGVEPGLDFNAMTIQLRPWTRAAMQIGLFHPTKGWRVPDNPATSVDTALETRLEGASATAILKLTTEARRKAREREQQERTPSVADATCSVRYRLSTPTYSEGIAFIDRSYICGGLCGEGATLAMEYRDRQWRLVAIRPGWIS
jgi:hypothetical protein